MTTCEKCIAWMGDSSSYAADCAKNVLTRPPFHATCPEWQPRSIQPIDMQSNARPVGMVIDFTFPLSGDLSEYFTIEECTE